MLRSTIKVGATSTDWSRSVADHRGYPAMGGAGWARLGQVKMLSRNHWVTGRLIPLGAPKERQRVAVATWDQVTHIDCPFIVMQRHMDYGVPSLVAHARANGQIVVNDLDDWFWGLHPNNRAYAETLATTNPHSNVDHYRAALVASNAVVVSTQFLAERVREWDSTVRVELIPNGVVSDAFPVRRHRRGPMTIGWAGSTAHRSGDLALLRKPFAALRKDVLFHHTGHHSEYPLFADEVDVDAKRVSVTPMLAPHQYPHGLTFDVGVVPLVDIPFNHAKSNIKGLEYAAAGIPFVASPLPEYERLAEEHNVGRIAKTARDWERHLKALTDYELRAEEGARLRKVVAAEYSAKQQARRWDDLVWELLQ